MPHRLGQDGQGLGPLPGIRHGEQAEICALLEVLPLGPLAEVGGKGQASFPFRVCNPNQPPPLLPSPGSPSPWYSASDSAVPSLAWAFNLIISVAN